ncbi:hypothetical protein PGT21_016369 [Puccinia graminis f. sp. tritici]|uniref:Uncharacterized protein n=1 Tax=Puccinia graminis f. sp. tritici TaxID=56615 RepID=A0A5B0PRU6_PUCGR|nr:hypothetical protein PGT21_016369 [Puccinia graminis f. sp. tritici]
MEVSVVQSCDQLGAKLEIRKADLPTPYACIIRHSVLSFAHKQKDPPYGYLTPDLQVITHPRAPSFMAESIRTDQHLVWRSESSQYNFAAVMKNCNYHSKTRIHTPVPSRHTGCRHCPLGSDQATPGTSATGHCFSSCGCNREKIFVIRVGQRSEVFRAQETDSKTLENTTAVDASRRIPTHHQHQPGPSRAHTLSIIEALSYHRMRSFSTRNIS